MVTKNEEFKNTKCYQGYQPKVTLSHHWWLCKLTYGYSRKWACGLQPVPQWPKLEKNKGHQQENGEVAVVFIKENSIQLRK